MVVGSYDDIQETISIQINESNTCLVLEPCVY